MDKVNSDIEQYYKWVKASDELPDNTGWYAIRHTLKIDNSIYIGGAFFDGYAFNDDDSLIGDYSWLKPVDGQQSQQQEIVHAKKQQAEWQDYLTVAADEGNNDSDAVEFADWRDKQFGEEPCTRNKELYTRFKQSKL